MINHYTPKCGTAWLLLLLTLCLQPARAFELQARIEQVTTDVLFIDQGSLAGLRTGDIGRVQLPGQPLLSLEVVFVSSKRASLRLPDGITGLAAGESILFELPDSRRIPAETLQPAPVDTLSPVATPARKVRRTSNSATALRGFVSVERFQETGKFSSQDHSLRGSLRSQQLAGLPIGFRSRFRLRQEQDAEGVKRWTSRVPLLEFAWQPANASWNLKWAGLPVPARGPAGSLDGLEVEQEFGAGQTLQAWLGVGTDPTNDRPDGALQKFGLGWGAQRRALGGELETGLALAGSWRGGEVEREFVSQRLTLALPVGIGPFSLGQESELDLNRGWRGERQNTLSMNRFDLRLRQGLGKSLQLMAGWRFQRSPLALEQKSLADSLLALHESGSFNLGANWKPWRALGLSAEASLLRDRGTLSEGRSLRVGLRHSQLPLGLAGGLSARLYHNSASDTRNLQGDLSRSLGRAARLNLKAGVQSVDTAGTTGSRQWTGLGLANLWRGAYLRGDAERETRDGSPAQQRFSAELGWRF